MLTSNENLTISPEYEKWSRTRNSAINVSNYSFTQALNVEAAEKDFKRKIEKQISFQKKTLIGTEKLLNVYVNTPSFGNDESRVLLEHKIKNIKTVIEYFENCKREADLVLKCLSSYKKIPDCDGGNIVHFEVNRVENRAENRAEKCYDHIVNVGLKPKADSNLLLLLENKENNENEKITKITKIKENQKNQKNQNLINNSNNNNNNNNNNKNKNNNNNNKTNDNKENIENNINTNNDSTNDNTENTENNTNNNTTTTTANTNTVNNNTTITNNTIITTTTTTNNNNGIDNDKENKETNANKQNTENTQNQKCKQNGRNNNSIKLEENPKAVLQESQSFDPKRSISRHFTVAGLDLRHSLSSRSRTSSSLSSSSSTIKDFSGLSNSILFEEKQTPESIIAASIEKVKISDDILKNQKQCLTQLFSQYCKVLQARKVTSENIKTFKAVSRCTKELGQAVLEQEEEIRMLIKQISCYRSVIRILKIQLQTQASVIAKGSGKNSCEGIFDKQNDTVDDSIIVETEVLDEIIEEEIKQTINSSLKGLTEITLANNNNSFIYSSFSDYDGLLDKELFLDLNKLKEVVEDTTDYSFLIDW